MRRLLGRHTTYDSWHVDQSYLPNVPSTTFFWVLEQPASGGGDTAFTSLTSAYAALSPAFAATLDGLSLWHERARLGTEPPDASADLDGIISTEHPLVIRHPVTGEPSLFINPAVARRIKGFLPEESEAILGFLHNHIRSLDFGCRVRWEPGTVVVWDQRGVAHSPVPDYKDGERRHMVRIIPQGTRPEPAFPEAHARGSDI